MRQLLADAGAALYGRDWQSALARDLAVTPRTMRRWVAGTHPPPPGIAGDLLRLIGEREKLLREVADRLCVSQATACVPSSAAARR